MLHYYDYYLQMVLVLRSWEILSVRVVAHPITILPFPRLLMPSWSLPLLWKGVMCAHTGVDSSVKRCNVMYPWNCKCM